VAELGEEKEWWKLGGGPELRKAGLRE